MKRLAPYAATFAFLLAACAPPHVSSPKNNMGADSSTQSASSLVLEETTFVEGGNVTDVIQANTALDPRSLTAGQMLSGAEIEAAGGADTFFWSENIPDEVFARMEGRSFGSDCTLSREELRYVRVLHVDADGHTFVGELVVNRAVADEVTDIFRQLYDAGYPIKKMRLVDDYGADDFASCADGNTAAFNYRTIAGTDQISNHAYGLAIDINTFENPYCVPATDYVFPPEAARYADRSLQEPYMIHPGDVCYDLFISRGWTWGGDWPSPKDYQHFEKAL